MARARYDLEHQNGNEYKDQENREVSDKQKQVSLPRGRALTQYLSGHNEESSNSEAHDNLEEAEEMARSSGELLTHSQALTLNNRVTPFFTGCALHRDYPPSRKPLEAAYQDYKPPRSSLPIALTSTCLLLALFCNLPHLKWVPFNKIKSPGLILSPLI